MVDLKIGQNVFLINKNSLKEPHEGMRIVKARVDTFILSKGKVIPLFKHGVREFSHSLYKCYTKAEDAIEVLQPKK